METQIINDALEILESEYEAAAAAADAAFERSHAPELSRAVRLARRAAFVKLERKSERAFNALVRATEAAMKLQ